MNKVLLLNSNGLVIDRKSLGIIERFKAAMTKEAIKNFKKEKGEK